MKKYIILTNSITNMGGGQMFAANKSIYLRENGWDVFIFFSNPKGDIFIPELKRYANNCIPGLEYPFYYLSRKERTSIISKVTRDILPDDDVVVESHTYISRYWGELIAKFVKGKHIIADLEEILPEPSINEFEYLDWKLKRNEILNATSEKSLRRYLGTKYEDAFLKYAHDYMTLAYCSNVTTNVEADLSLLPKADFTILSVGRLDKPYILPSVKEIVDFARDCSDYNINLLFVGGSTTGMTDKLINDMCNDIHNLHVHHFGYIFPVPENIIDSSDVAFACSNSVLVSANRGIPTISIDVHDLQPIGIYGKTTRSHFSRGDEPIVPIKELLKQVLIEKRFMKESRDNHDEKLLFNKVFGKQLDFLSISPKDSAFYDVDSLFPWYKRWICRMKYIAHRIYD